MSKGVTRIGSGAINVLFDEARGEFPFLILNFVVLREQEARDLHRSLGDALILWDAAKNQDDRRNR